MIKGELIMSLQELLTKYNLLRYVIGLCSDLDKFRFDAYEQIENGFIIHSDQKIYKVRTMLYSEWIRYPQTNDSYVYQVEIQNSNGEFEELSLNNQHDEEQFPKVLRWLGTALISNENSNIYLKQTS